MMSHVGCDEARVTLDVLGQEIFRLVGLANRERVRSSRGFRALPPAFEDVRVHNVFTGDGGDRSSSRSAGKAPLSSRGPPACSTRKDAGPLTEREVDEIVAANRLPEAPLELVSEAGRVAWGWDVPLNSTFLGRVW